jgi:hypothetical protein
MHLQIIAFVEIRNDVDGADWSFHCQLGFPQGVPMTSNHVNELSLEVSFHLTCGHIRQFLNENSRVDHCVATVESKALEFGSNVTPLSLRFTEYGIQLKIKQKGPKFSVFRVALNLNF